MSRSASEGPFRTARGARALMVAFGASAAMLAVALSGCSPQPDTPILPSPGKTIFPTEGPSVGALPACAPDALAFTLTARPADSSSAAVYWDLVMTSSSAALCSVAAIPTVVVSATSSSTSISGGEAEAPRQGSGFYALEPGAQAYSLITLFGLDPNACASPIDGLLVTMPQFSGPPLRVAAPAGFAPCATPDLTFTAGSFQPAPITF